MSTVTFAGYTRKQGFEIAAAIAGHSQASWGIQNRLSQSQVHQAIVGKSASAATIERIDRFILEQFAVFVDRYLQLQAVPTAAATPQPDDKCAT